MAFQHARAQAIREFKSLDHGIAIKRVFRRALQSLQPFFQTPDCPAEK